MYRLLLISIHVLRVEDDVGAYWYSYANSPISIHVLRVEDDNIIQIVLL